MKSHWNLTEKNIQLITKNRVIFSDTVEHWQNGILRLLNLQDEECRSWLESVLVCQDVNWLNLSFSDKYERLIKKTNIFFGVNCKLLPIKSNLEIWGNKVDKIFTQVGGVTDGFKVAGNEVLLHGVAINNQGDLLSPCEYEEDYFEGKIFGKGYGQYLSQQSWRLEKAKRLLNIILEKNFLTHDSEIKLLDIGAGYGFFRKAAEEAGIKTTGLEISAYANQASKELFGLSAVKGEIQDYFPGNKFEIICAFDVIEHFQNPDSLIENIIRLLKKNGTLAIRTPNLDSLEFKALGGKFYSIKPEHLNYFSPKSLSYLLTKYGFQISYINTSSHFFQGVVGLPIDIWTSSNQGSDIFVIAKI